MASVLLIGGAGGVGGEVLKMLLERGDQVVTTVLNEAQKEEVMLSSKGKTEAHIVDLSNPMDCKNTLDKIIQNMKTLDAVAVCAAIAPYGPVETTPLEVFAKSFNINTTAAVAVYQASLSKLRASSGRIVFISSMAGKAAMPFVGAYVASKFALEGIADVMRREAAPQGVKISLIEPGGIRTNMVDEQLETIKDRIKNLSPEERKLYEPLYLQFQELAGHSHQTTASTAQDVANILLEALTHPDPEPRYIAGEDAKQLLGLVASLRDREMDGAFAQMFASENKN